MARPLRIEYSGAWYHVMNRGAGHREIYSDDVSRRRFLMLLDDINERYDVEIHAWCLMSNHYHLLVCTPKPNLGRAMRHVDGVYAQWWNRHRGTDGPLFRGRYKAILVDSNSYLLQLSRYIHRNPLEANLVDRAEHWRWSSYRAYLGLETQPPWLSTSRTLEAFTGAGARQRYRKFVDAGVDKAIQAFYSARKVAPVLGDEAFCRSIDTLLENIDRTEVPDRKRVLPTPDIAEIVASTAAEFSVVISSITEPSRGRQNLPRMVAMSLCRSPGGYPLTEIARFFEVGSYSAVVQSAKRLERHLNNEALAVKVTSLKAELFASE